MLFASGTAKRHRKDRWFVEMLPFIWKSMEDYMIDEETFSSMNKDEKAAYCAKLDEFQRVYMTSRQTADKRISDEHSEKIENTLNAMESSLADIKRNPCLKWTFETSFDEAMLM